MEPALGVPPVSEACVRPVIVFVASAPEPAAPRAPVPARATAVELATTVAVMEPVVVAMRVSAPVTTVLEEVRAATTSTRSAVVPMTLRAIAAPMPAAPPPVPPPPTEALTARIVATIVGVLVAVSPRELAVSAEEVASARTSVERVLSATAPAPPSATPVVPPAATDAEAATA